MVGGKHVQDARKQHVLETMSEEREKLGRS